MCCMFVLCTKRIGTLALILILINPCFTVSSDTSFSDTKSLNPAFRNSNSTGIYGLNLTNIDAKYNLFIDLIERNFSILNTDITILKETLIHHHRHDSAIFVDLNESLYPSSSSPRKICVQQRSARYSHVDPRDGGVTIVSQCEKPPTISGIRAHGDRVHNDDDGIVSIPTNVKVKLFLFGTHFNVDSDIAFIDESLPRGSKCDNFPLIKVISLSQGNVLSDKVIQFDISLPPLDGNRLYYICVKDKRGSIPSWLHQGRELQLALRPVGRILPIGLQSVILCFLLILSGLFSGLNLGLMSLECTELLVLEKCGTESEKKHARKIYPVRKQSNYLLCSLLLGNVLVNNTLTILLDDLTSGIIAVIVSTFGIVIFGEIIPQAICSRHGLAIGAKTLWVTKVFMVLTFPLSFPISKILDCVLGEEIRNVYNRKRLMEFIRVTKDFNDLHNEEVDIISGALELTKKTVADVMTKINDVFMVPYSAVLDFETVSEIIKQGYSRIPVFDGDRNNIVALLNIKDLAFVDPDTETQLKTLCEFYNHPINFVFEDTTLDVMLNEFKKGRSHMAFVRRVNNEADGDPFYELTGIVTLEDVIEEIIQSEIIDETDVLTDNRRKRVRKESQIKQDFSDFARLGIGDKKSTAISPQLALATYQFLSTSVDPFKSNYISESVLKKLMSQDVYFKAKSGKEDLLSPSNVLFQNGKPADYFVLILEGRCIVTVGFENLVFETGPFSSFGLPSIMMNNFEISTTSNINSPENSPFKVFVPDYTVVAAGETIYMKVHCAVYLSAVRATLLEKQQKQDSDSREDSKAESGRNSRQSSKDLHEHFLDQL
ncbi:unextended protein-like [Parasteatoda tepidariorum]|uniref:unextended protein-like n=1 Tax=Parasteatoda tepidariorum TaxID=114398 RepID=UPI001C722953|nr:unextended protein-like [Parasteatoda tepidariorum]